MKITHYGEKPDTQKAWEIVHGLAGPGDFKDEDKETSQPQDGLPFDDKDVFLAWEKSSRDTIDVKKVYIDVAGDLVAGILLSQIIFWFLPSANGNSRIRINRDGRLWLAKKREDWWDECRITPRQFDRAISILEERGLIKTAIFKFAGSPTKHISLNYDTLIQGVKSILHFGGNGNHQRGKWKSPKREKPVVSGVSAKTESANTQEHSFLTFGENRNLQKGKNHIHRLHTENTYILGSSNTDCIDNNALGSSNSCKKMNEVASDFTVEDKKIISVLAFPELSLGEHLDRLLNHDDELGTNERKGLLFDLLLVRKKNSLEVLSFLNRNSPKGYRALYGVITDALARFGTRALVDIFTGVHVIPLLSGKNWRRYMFGWLNRAYVDFRAKREIAEHERIKEEGSVLGPERLGMIKQMMSGGDHDTIG